MSKKEKESLKSLMKGYKKVSREIISTLSKFGLQVSSCKNHYKFIRVDGVGGSVTIASTASDYRAGLNAAQHLIRLIEL